MIARLLQVRRGETSRTVLLFAYLFIIITSYVATKATRDALFLGRFSAARLPYVDIASALTVAAMMAVYLRIHRLVSLRVMLNGTLAVFSASALGFWALGRSDEPAWMLPALYIWASVFGVLLPAQVWTLANSVLTTREAKRLYGVVGSGAICGWIVGGVLTKATASRFGAESLLLLTSVALACCPLLVGAIWRQRPTGHASEPGERGDDAAPRGLRDSARLVWRSPYLRSIAGIVCLSSLVTTIAAWQFRAIAKAHIPETDALAAFFGTFNIYAGLLSLATQLFVTSRLLRRYGLGVALLVVPIALTAGSVGVLVWGGLGAAIFLKGGDQVLRYSIDRSTVEMLYLPVPARQTFHAKAFIDTVLWRVGDCVGALLVLACVGMMGLSASQISAVAIPLLAAWIVAASLAERHYVQSLRRNIYEHRVDAERLSSAVIDGSTSKLFTAALGSTNPDDILYALTLFKGREAELTPAAVRPLLDHDSPAVRKAAIAVLAASGDATVVAQVERLLQDGDPGVRSEALLYLARMTDVDPLARLSDLDHVDDSSLASAMATFLSRSGPGQNLVAVGVLLDAAIAHSGPGGELARRQAARLIGSLASGFDGQLKALLQDPAPEVVRSAIHAAGTPGRIDAIGAAGVAPLLAARLGDPLLSADAADALAALGEAAVPALAQALANDLSVPAARYAVPDVLGRIGTPSAEHALVESLLDPDPILRLRVVTALNKVRQLNPQRRIEPELVKTVLAAEILGHYRSYQILGTFLAGLADVASGQTAPNLDDAMAREIERIFRLMKVLLPGDDWHSAYFGLRSTNPVAHANALEFLEHTLPPQLRTLLLPLIDSEISIADRVKIANQIFGEGVDSAERVLAAQAATEALRDVARATDLRLD